jgi:hypothetical protein
LRAERKNFVVVPMDQSEKLLAETIVRDEVLGRDAGYAHNAVTCDFCQYDLNSRGANQARAKDVYGGIGQQAAAHRDQLGIAGKEKDVASVHPTLWPEETLTELIDGAILMGHGTGTGS